MSDKAYRQLRFLLVGNDLEPGSPLDADEFAGRLKADREAVESALATLGTEGLVVHVPGEGARLPTFEPDDIRQLIKTRTATETAVGRLAAERATDAGLRDLAAMQRASVTLLGIGGTVPLTTNFHHGVARLAGDGELARDLGLLYDKLRLARPIAMRGPARMREAWREHGVILRALTARDGAAVEEAIVAHLVSIEKTVLGARG